MSVLTNTACDLENEINRKQKQEQKLQEPQNLEALEAPKTRPRTPKKSLIEPSPTPAALPESLPAWMQKALMADGRVAFKGSKIGLKVGKLHNNSLSLGEMINIAEDYKKNLKFNQIHFETNPKSATLREKFVCIAFASSKEGARADLEFAVILYDNGWVEYQSTGRGTVFQLSDCLNFTYNYGYAIDGIDKTELDKELLRNENWVTCACLTGEERITNSLNRHSSAVSSDSSEEDDKSDHVGHEVERDKRRKREEPVTMARIPTPEERIFAQERHKEISSIFERTLENLSEKGRLNYTNFILSTAFLFIVSAKCSD